MLRLPWLLCCLLPCCSWGSAVAYAWTRGRSSAPCVTARGRFVVCGSASLGRSPLLRAMFFFVAALPATLLLVGLLGHLRLGSWVLRRSLCDSSWVLRRLPLCRSWSLPHSVCCLSRLLCGPQLRRSWDSAAALAWVCGRSSALCATARERYAAYRVAYLGRAPTPCAISLGAAPCSAACGALLSLMPELVNAPPPFVRRLVGASLPIALSLLMAPLPPALSFDVVALPPALLLVGVRCHFHLCLSPWALPALGATACWRFAAYCSATSDRSPAPCAVSPGCCAAPCSAARGAPSSRTPWLVGAPLLLVRLLVGALLPIALPLSMAPLPRALSFDVLSICG